MTANGYAFENTIGITVGNAHIYGTLIIPSEAWSAVIFAHGSGSSRDIPRYLAVGQALHRVGLATLLVDLLTPTEERVDQLTARYRFDMELLTNRLLSSTDWLLSNFSQYEFRIGYFGAGTGAGAMFKAAARRPDIAAIVSRGGRPDLAEDELADVQAATLLLVGGLDLPHMNTNQIAYRQLERAHRREIQVVPGATHLFEEKGALEQVSLLSTQWFVRYLDAAAGQSEDQKPILRSRQSELSTLFEKN